MPIKKAFAVIFFLLYVCIHSQKKDYCNEWKKIIDTTQNYKLINKISWKLASKVDDICRAKIFINQGYLYINLRNADSSAHYLDKAILLAIKNKKQELLAEAYSKRAYAHALKNEEKKAEEVLKRTKKILANYPKSEHWVLYYQTYAYLADIKSDYKTALKYTDSSVVFSEMNNIINELPSCYGNQGTYAIRLSNYEKAVDSYIKAITILERENSSEIDVYYNVLATAYKRLDQFDLAIKYYNKSLIANTKSKNDFVKMLTYSRMSDAQKKSNLYQQAITSIDSSIHIAKKLNNDNFIADGYHSKGTIYLDMIKDYKKAEVFLTKAYNTKIKTNSTKKMSDMNEFSIVDGMVRISLHNKNITEAKKYINELEQQLKKTNTANFRETLYKRKSSYFELIKNYSKANTYLKLFHKIKDSTENKTTKTKVAELEKKYDTQKKELEIANLNEENALKEKQIVQSKLNQRVLIFSLVSIGLFLIFGFFTYSKIKKQGIQLVENNAELSELNAVKNRLFSILSHDLRGMLIPFQRAGKVIKHYADKGDKDKTIALSQELENNSQKLSNTLDNILNWSLQQMNSYNYKEELISIEKELSEIIGNYSYHAKLKNTELVLDLEKDENILFDKGAFHVIFRNLISNALKFTENGIVKIVSSKSINSFNFSIIDTGIGMTKQQLEHLFTFRNNSTINGTQGENGMGIGLKIVQKFVELHEGKINASSENSIGTKFDLSFPIK
ncbi:tetratricopeptide repeat-containing sensor histidine kinase [Tenacibaculum agarivorans]|uniref:tetratricopeptide repeat-containing sensor histidine kinase n=1 Tax=Tenacibaculum agarivorans TaxID=1908389 RepID=UPI00094B871F|nr:ATP-binding protein [Tenacibaculum agarivorans]